MSLCYLERSWPARYVVGAGSDYFPNSPSGMYRVLFYEMLDRDGAALEERFNQPSYEVFAEME